MLKFFGKIRQKLLSENKFSKYLFYAIGEIVLVMIGILLALQVNNWNESRKDHKKEQELLLQLQSEFKSNLMQLDEKIALRDNMINASFRLLDFVDHPPKRNNDSILKYLGFTVLSPTFDPIVNDINSSGRIQLIKSTKLKEKLSRWTSEIVQVTEEEQVWLHYRNNNYMPILLEKGMYRNLVNQYWEDNIIEAFHLDKNTKTDFHLGDTKKEIDLFDLLDEVQFENHIAQCATFSNLANTQSHSLRNRIVEILDLIKKGIEQ
ncbi:hypothetical protein MTsPCn9_15430 [Croceitalea sp. MTPC9]|uniref:DUF6090 family protein n=1 Tax=unclassified Croceitalea TaxID=2632280 RepID=UPI002B3B911D|nr:hypothetical protein MTsPCn6_13700 [Croceitalea sp. MTPC6]GMN16607.1 hypothetical protein MTsPCn9_15430 [Croceitalea sp. MTPC9]